MKLKVLTLTAAAAAMLATSMIPITATTASAASYYPTKYQLQNRTRVRAAYASRSGGLNDPCYSVRAFPSRYDQSAIDQCGPY